MRILVRYVWYAWFTVRLHMCTSLSFLRHVLKSKFHNASVQSDQRLCCSAVLFLIWLFFIDRKIVCEQCWFWPDWQFAQADLNSLFATFLRYIITGSKSLRSSSERIAQSSQRLWLYFNLHLDAIDMKSWNFHFQYNPMLFLTFYWLVATDCLRPWAYTM